MEMLNTIGSDEVHIYYIRFDSMRSTVPDVLNHISASEISRAGKFKSAFAGERFIVGRIWLRKLLGSYTSQHPSEIEFNFNHFGKPEINTDGKKNEKISFNLSHSGDLIVYAFCVNNKIGIDTEKIDPSIDHLELAEQFCTKTELCYLKQMTSKEKLVNAFFSIWTRKEAVAKGLGIGISDSLRHIEVLNDNISFDQYNDLKTIEVTNDWKATEVKIDINYKTAFAYSGDPKKILLQQL